MEILQNDQETKPSFGTESNVENKIEEKEENNAMKISQEEIDSIFQEYLEKEGLNNEEEAENS